MPTPEPSPPSQSETPKEAPKEASKESPEGPKQADPVPDPKDSDSKLAPSSGKGPTKPQRQQYPLYPSVSQLLHEKGLDKSEVDKIPASGPKGRLLKGDVLAHVGAIDAGYPGKQAERISTLEHLDLSNIKVAPPPEPTSPTKPDTAAELPPTEEPTDVEVAMPISFETVVAVQRRIQKTLGVEIPVETFVARAVRLSNSDLPPSKLPPTTDELFDDILGIDGAHSKASQGSFLPDITSTSPVPAPMPLLAPKPDVYDILAGTMPRRKVRLSAAPAPVAVDEGMNVFSVRAPKGDEKRARIFLERMKTTLQVEPGSLIM